MQELFLSCEGGEDAFLRGKYVVKISLILKHKTKLRLLCLS